MEANGLEHVLDERKSVLVEVTPQRLQEGWAYFEPVLSKACERSRGEFTLEAILANLEHWPILAIIHDGGVRALMVTGVGIMANGERVLNCLLAAGDHAREWPAVDDQFDAFARRLGCTRVRIPCARKGWLQALTHWRVRGYVLEREI